MALLSLQNISFSYDKTPVLRDISYDFEKGKMYCIIGKSGAGKTTLLSLLSGLAKPTAGDIIYDGKSIAKIDKYTFRSRYIGVVFQSFNLITKYTALENVILSMDVSGAKIKDKKQKALRFILAAKLFSASYAKSLSVTDLPLHDETHIAVANYISDCERKGERVRPSELFEILDENCPEFNAILDLNYGDKLVGEIAERFFTDSVKTLRLEAVEEEVAKCNAEYAKATQEEQRREIAKRLGALIQKRNQIKKS